MSTQTPAGRFGRGARFGFAPAAPRAAATATTPQLQHFIGVLVIIVEGGIEAWKKAGLPVERDRNQPIELQRQVMIAAGSLVLLGVLLGQLFAAGFYVLPAFVGAGLAFAGVTGWCGMAKLLALLPWNRPASST